MTLDLIDDLFERAQGGVGLDDHGEVHRALDAAHCALAGGHARLDGVVRGSWLHQFEFDHPDPGVCIPRTDRDLAFLQATAPQLAQTADGRRTIMNSFRSVAQREQQVAKMAEEYKRRNGGRLDDGFFERLSA